jgi:hypothetical protein
VIEDAERASEGFIETRSSTSDGEVGVRDPGLGRAWT